MKLKELLDEKGLSDSISKNLEEALFSKINNFVIDLLIKQDNIDISSFIQKLALLLNNDYKREVISTINFISVNNIINKPLVKTGLGFSSRISEQLSKTMDVQISENLKHQISDSIKNSLSADISGEDELTHKITQRLNMDLKDQIKEQLSHQFHVEPDEIHHEHTKIEHHHHTTEHKEDLVQDIKTDNTQVEKKDTSKLVYAGYSSDFSNLNSNSPKEFNFNFNKMVNATNDSNVDNNNQNNITIVNSNNSPSRTIIQTIQQVGAVALLPDGTPDYTIDESGTALGITIGRTTRMEVVNIMKNFSTVNNSQTLAKQLNYDDVGLNITFNDQKIVKGLTFSKKYKGLTSSGLKIGDRLEKAIEIYGAPQYKTTYNAVWKEIALFCEEANIISSIRLQV
jgi:hypothetical protein